ncbi:hypothetical protein TSUD_281540 [Trifolium subterraneum]|uniref:Uncharacterized protein n=1 Tax=Trifolium subterraneum TaxID=3900 RepID=A0A2Z6LUY9_TRISU|nr:hypothetical protein TSUD_281540 [Trifolium subterraneum]
MEAACQVDEDQGSCLDEFLSKLQTFHLEFDAYCVRVVKKHDGLYFEDGWFQLRRFYSIWFGGWVSLTYINPKLMSITVLTRWGSEVKYPLNVPPLKRLLVNGSDASGVGSSASDTSFNPRLYPKCFARSYFKEMTAYDVDSGILILPWYAFGESAFANVYSDLVLEDYTGAQYKCHLKFGVDASGEFCCKITL